jgi:hypothetical protein
MEGLTLATGIILMLVAAIGIVFYVALVIAIPVCRMLDWLFDKDRKTPVIRPSHSGARMRIMPRRVTAIARRIHVYCHRKIRGG